MENHPDAAPEKLIVVAVGLPAAGKSAYFARHGLQPLSSDWLRTVLLGDEADQRHREYIFSALRTLLRLRLLLGQPVSYVDATHLTRRERAGYFALARRFGSAIEALYFDVPLEVCLERNRQRRRRVPDDKLREMAARLEPPSVEEGFRRVVVVQE
ncbi:MAG: AAA family ATPase [Terriglobia bacterium]